MRRGILSLLTMYALMMGDNTVQSVQRKEHPSWFYEIKDLPEEYERIKRKESNLSSNQRAYIIRLVERLKLEQSQPEN